MVIFQGHFSGRTTAETDRTARLIGAVDYPLAEVVRDVAVIREFVLAVTFGDAHTREVELSAGLPGPIFEPLRDPASFRMARFDADIETVVWPNGADLAPSFPSGA